MQHDLRILPHQMLSDNAKQKNELNDFTKWRTKVVSVFSRPRSNSEHELREVEILCSKSHI